MNDEQSEAGAENAGGATTSTVRRMMSNPSDSSRTPESTLGNDVQAKIGQHLRAMYDDVVRQGVPDRFMDLLARLDDKAEEKPAGTSDDGAGR